MVKKEIIAAEIAGCDPYEIMGKEAQQSPVGSNNVMFNPSLMGEATVHPSPHIRGAFFNLELGHNKSDLIRAVMEGVAYDLRMVLHSFRQMIRNVEEIRIVGGGSKSNFWRQIFADIYNTNIVMTNIGQEAAALGAATIASVGTGIWKDFTIVDTIAKTINITHPNNNNVQEYEKRIPLFNFASQKLFEIGEKAKLISDS